MFFNQVSIAQFAFMITVVITVSHRNLEAEAKALRDLEEETFGTAKQHSKRGYSNAANDFGQSIQISSSVLQIDDRPSMNPSSGSHYETALENPWRPIFPSSSQENNAWKPNTPGLPHGSIFPNSNSHETVTIGLKPTYGIITIPTNAVDNHVSNDHHHNSIFSYDSPRQPINVLHTQAIPSSTHIIGSTNGHYEQTNGGHVSDNIDFHNAADITERRTHGSRSYGK